MRMKILLIYFNMADTYRNNFDDDTKNQTGVRRNNRRKSKVKLKSFAYNKDEDFVDYWDISTELEDDSNFEKFNKRK